MRVDPAALGEPLEQRAVEPARGTIVDVLHSGLMAQPGVAQTGVQPAVTPVAGLLVEQQGEPFGMGQRGGFTGCFDLAKRLRHTVEPELT